ncbi:MAG: response regulator, partial [Pseudomonadota bacterium]
MPIKILVFESDAGFAEQLTEGFTALGCETTVVDDANLGLAAASRQKPDLILLSIELPRMNGFSVCNKLKRDAALKDVPLIIMSSESTEETFEQHRRLRTRAEDYIHKPIGFDELLGRLQPYVSIPESGPSTHDSTEGLGDELVLDDDIEIEDDELVEGEPEVEASLRESTVDQDVSDFADQAFGALESPQAAPPEDAVEIAEPEIAEPEIAEPEIASARFEVEAAEPEVAHSVPAEPGVIAPEPSEHALLASEPEITEVDAGELADEPLSLSDIEPLSAPPPALPLNTSRPPAPPARVPSARVSNVPRAPDLGDTNKF